MRFLLLVTLWLAGWGASPAMAADAGVTIRAVSGRAPAVRTIPRSPEAALVWAADSCWRGCAQQCGRGLRACLRGAEAESCLALTDACDRFCQRDCRRYGGPLLPLD